MDSRKRLVQNFNGKDSGLMPFYPYIPLDSMYHTHMKFKSSIPVTVTNTRALAFIDKIGSLWNFLDFW